MARTEMMKRLQHLSRLSRVAGATGGDLAEAEGQLTASAASDRGLSRRDVLRAGVLAGAGAAVAGTSVLQAPRASAALAAPRYQPRIAVIGAGASGMTAAMTLKDSGFRNVTVYEANTRIGGRTYTERSFWDAGQWSEYGGELIDTDHTAVLALCRRFGIPLIDLTTVYNPGSKPILHFGGSYYPWAHMVQDWQSSTLDAVLSQQINHVLPETWTYDQAWSPQAIALSKLTAYDWIERYVPGGHASRLGKFIDTAYVVEYGAETREQSCLCLIVLLGYNIDPAPEPADWWVWGTSDERFKLVGGNQQIALAQADYLGSSNIHTGWSLTGLRQYGSTQSLTFDTGGSSRTVTSDAVVLALPIGVLKELQAHQAFASAGFDARKTAQIASMPMGAVNKLQIQTTDRFYARPGAWGNSNGISFSDRGYDQFWDATWGEPGTRGVVINYFAGDAARAINPSKPWSNTSDSNPSVAGFVRGAAANFLHQVEPVFPGMTAHYTGRATLSAWHTSPFQRGAYSYWPPSYVERYAGYEGVAMGGVHFAGEHCSVDWQGYINGAVEEGHRAAREIAARFS